MQVRIYRTVKNAMQSGRGNLGQWLVEYEPQTPRRPEPLMGWVASEDTLNQIRLRFDSQDEAVAYARRKGLAYTVEPDKTRRVVPRNYADNFRPRPTR